MFFVFFSEKVLACLFVTLDLDECRGNNNHCHQNAVCTNTLGSYKCQCATGYTGDGFSCSGKKTWHFLHLFSCKEKTRSWTVFSQSSAWNVMFIVGRIIEFTSWFDLYNRNKNMEWNACNFKKSYKKCLQFKRKVEFVFVLVTYIDLPEIVQKVKLNLFSF